MPTRKCKECAATLHLIQCNASSRFGKFAKANADNSKELSALSKFRSIGPAAKNGESTPAWLEVAAICPRRKAGRTVSRFLRRRTTHRVSKKFSGTEIKTRSDRL